MRWLGSSPRGRGKLGRGLDVHCSVRLIPARAGKTSSFQTARSWGAAHPRAGGENPHLVSVVRMVCGSSPRGRGKPDEWEHRRRRAGLIPARAGKTQFIDSRFKHSLGSSPRGRGKPLRASLTCHGSGLIPARAGKTSWLSKPDCQATAHPRAGGENEYVTWLRAAQAGSSPRGRGKLLLELSGVVPLRLIPARAGKTMSCHCDMFVSPAHPRAGGENPLVETIHSCESGSSPRGRGKQLIQRRIHAPRRLIPARAGKTPNASRPSAGAAAHPRAGGENDLTEPIMELIPGSSPRGRGKLGISNQGRAPPRLIPARAGKTAKTQTQGWVGVGSSPRGRGKPSRVRTCVRCRGLIPARAGKTLSLARTQPCRRAHPRAGGENRSEPSGLGTVTGSSPRGRGKPVPRRVAN